LVRELRKEKARHKTRQDNKGQYSEIIIGNWINNNG
jgi:hypothetical protein